MSIILSGRDSGLVDADQVLPGLFVGGETALQNFDLLNPTPRVVVSAAQQVDPQEKIPPGKKQTLEAIQHLPLIDTETNWSKSPDAWSRVVMMARYVAFEWAKGNPVLVVCHAGMNRSAMLVGLALRFLGLDGLEAVKRIQRYRRPSLMNRSFREAVMRFTPPLTFPWNRSILQET